MSYQLINEMGYFHQIVITTMDPENWTE